MAWTIPNTNYWAYKRGSAGIGVWSLQRALNQRNGAGLVLDGDFGPATDTAVRDFQTDRHLTVDGIAGGGTQGRLVSELVLAREKQTPMVPSGLLPGFVEGEGGYWLANTNWSVPGGVDCGCVQRRVFQADFDDDAVIQRAFDNAYQLDLLADGLANLRTAWIGKAGVNDGYAGMGAREKAWRLAALNHNWPSGASILSQTPIEQLYRPYWYASQHWVVNIGARFPDGTVVAWPIQWAHFYAGVLGAGVHGTTGLVTEHVSAWP